MATMRGKFSGGLVSSALAVLLCTATAAAQPAPAPTAAPGDAAGDERRERARKLYERGRQALDQHQYDVARQRFVEALPLWDHYLISANLGVAELELKRYRDAAEHLQQALRGMAGDETVSVADRLEIERALAKATPHVGQLDLRIQFVGSAVDGVQVNVDGIEVGVTPLPPLFVEPGVHVVEVRAPKLTTADQAVEAAAGSRHQLAFQLQVARDAAPEPPAEAAPDEEPSRPPWPQAVAGIVAGSGLILGVVAIPQANIAGTEVDEAAARVQALSPGSEHITCATPTTATVTDCNAWRDARAKRTDWTAVAATSLAVAGGATLVGVAFMLWPTSSDESDAGAASLRATPSFGPGFAALHLSGRF